ncbi:carboxylating nicotinate-nucleotide diphosphorylase [Nocardioides panacisoli]|uniref:carboxylating nicotinate-nucleotide diphosphorylase n=1 Tax=Nocardioides panacisoli TaxID=627624 RepID=UPI0031DFE36B
MADALAPMMPPGVPPIALFRTFAKNLPMTKAMHAWGSYELGRALSLSLRDREILIDRTCVRCGCEYEWGVHVSFFADRAGLSSDQVTSLTHGSPDDSCWSSARDRLLVRAADALHDDSSISESLWELLAVEFDETELLDILLLCGWYHAISFAANAAGVPLEPHAPTFDSVKALDGAGSARDTLRRANLDPAEVLRLLRTTLAEDLSDAGDLTSSAVVPADANLEVTFTSRQSGVACGLPVVALLCEDAVGPSARFTSLVADGDGIAPGQHLATLSAPAPSVLAVERTALNLLTHLSGIATATRAWVDAVEGTGVTVRDTRKTTPLLRSLEKYAVRCGGGTNHRQGLFDEILVKDNHIAAAGGIANALDRVAAAHPGAAVPVQIEVDTLDQLDEALAHGADQIMLDNFAVSDMRVAVERARGCSRDVRIEASGGFRLGDAREVALTGVDSISVGSITHSAPAIDIGLDASMSAGRQ